MNKQIKFIDFIFIVDNPRKDEFVFVSLAFETLERLLKCSGVFFVTPKCRSPPAFKFQKFWNLNGGYENERKCKMFY